MNKEIALWPCTPVEGYTCSVEKPHFHWSWPQKLESGKTLLHSGVFVMPKTATLLEFDALLMQHAREVVEAFWDKVKARRQWIAEEVARESGNVTVQEADR